MEKTCAHCGGPLPKGSRYDRETCRDSHRVMWNRWKRKSQERIDLATAILLRGVSDDWTPHQLREYNRSMAKMQGRVETIQMKVREYAVAGVGDLQLLWGVQRTLDEANENR